MSNDKLIANFRCEVLENVASIVEERYSGLKGLEEDAVQKLMSIPLDRPIISLPIEVVENILSLAKHAVELKPQPLPSGVHSSSAHQHEPLKVECWFSKPNRRYRTTVDTDMAPDKICSIMAAEYIDLCVRARRTVHPDLDKPALQNLQTLLSCPERWRRLDLDVPDQHCDSTFRLCIPALPYIETLCMPRYISDAKNWQSDNITAIRERLLDEAPRLKSVKASPSSLRVLRSNFGLLRSVTYLHLLVDSRGAYPISTRILLDVICSLQCLECLTIHGSFELRLGAEEKPSNLGALLPPHLRVLRFRRIRAEVIYSLLQLFQTCAIVEVAITQDIHENGLHNWFWESFHDLFPGLKTLQYQGDAVSTPSLLRAAQYAIDVDCDRSA